MNIQNASDEKIPKIIAEYDDDKSSKSRDVSPSSPTTDEPKGPSSLFNSEPSSVKNQSQDNKTNTIPVVRKGMSRLEQQIVKSQMKSSISYNKIMHLN